MKRRVLLRTLSTCTIPTSGCLASRVLNGDKETANQESFPEVSVHDVANLSEIDLELDANVPHQFESDSPAHLTITLTNLAEQDRSWIFGPVAPFNELRGQHKKTNAELWLIPFTAIHEEELSLDTEYPHIASVNTSGDMDGDHTLIPESPQNGCWKALNRLTRTQPGTPLEIEAEGALTEEYILLAGVENEGCLPAGQYVFEDNRYHAEENAYPGVHSARIVLKVEKESD